MCLAGDLRYRLEPERTLSITTLGAQFANLGYLCSKLVTGDRIWRRRSSTLKVVMLRSHT